MSKDTGKHVLIVDPFLSVREDIKRALRHRQYEALTSSVHVDYCKEPAEAQAKITHLLEQGKTVAGMITTDSNGANDHHQLTGFKLAEWVRGHDNAELKKIPVIMLVTSKANEAFAKINGANQVVQKAMSGEPDKSYADESITLLKNELAFQAPRSAYDELQQALQNAMQSKNPGTTPAIKQSGHAAALDIAGYQAPKEHKH